METHDIRSHVVERATGDNRLDFNMTSAPPCVLRMQRSSSVFSQGIVAKEKLLKYELYQVSRHVCTFRDYASSYGEELSAPHPTPKLEGHPLSTVRDCLLNIFAATLHIGGRSSIR